MTITALVLGAGGRGNVYSEYALAHPKELSVVAVAEPRPDRRAYFVGRHDIAPDRSFTTWEDAIAGGKIADVVINTTMDRTHFDSTMAALAAGYHVLLEKPMSPVLLENVRLIQQAEATGSLLQICHVLRFAPFWRRLRAIVASGRLGRIISVDHRENLVYWHMAHSFVRGNWRREDIAGPMILAKCCHDFDMLYWILRQPVRWLTSLGGLTHFRAENAPEGAPARCTDGCPVAETCKYYAPRLYGSVMGEYSRRVVTLDPRPEALDHALRTGDYGRCVYHCDNDVVDHQVVSMELTDGTSVTLTMQGQSEVEGRTMRYDGTLATLCGTFTYGDSHLTIHDHRTGAVERIDIPEGDGGGHGGGDLNLVASFLRALHGDADDGLTTARESLESHLLAFAAEEARHTRAVIDMDEYRRRVDADARSIAI